MKKIALLIIGMLTVSAFFISGCVEENNQGDATTSDGTLQLKITDKPGDLDIIYANVTISNVLVHTAEVDEEENNDDEGNGEDGFTVDAHGEYEGLAGQDIQFLGSADGGEEPYNWSWDFGDGNTSYVQNPIHNYSLDGVYEVNLTVIDNTSATVWDATIATIGEEETEEDSEDGWIVIINESQTFDLIALLNVSQILGEKDLDPGKYTQIRLTIESAEITINNNETIEIHNLTIPSKTIKLIKAFWIVEDETTVLTLDFDIYESVHQTGSNKFILKPTIKVIQG
jgi:hypothetical protein